MALAVGSTAPAFSLRGRKDGQFFDFNLADYLGKEKLVLVFVPAAFSGVCTTELCTFSDALDAYEGMGARVVAISVDGPFAQEAWVKAAGIKETVLSDTRKAVIELYDVVFPDFAGFGPTAARAVFVIDRSGKIVHAQQTASPGELPDFEAVRAAVQAA